MNERKDGLAGIEAATEAVMQSMRTQMGHSCPDLVTARIYAREFAKAALRSTGAGRSEAEGSSGLSNAELEAEALRYQAIAAEQGSTIMRLRIAMKLLTESGHGGAIHTARKWFAGGGTGPIPWLGGTCFDAWAEEQGYSEVDGCVGFRLTARALPAQTTGGAGE